MIGELTGQSLRNLLICSQKVPQLDYSFFFWAGLGGLPPGRLKLDPIWPSKNFRRPSGGVCYEFFSSPGAAGEKMVFVTCLSNFPLIFGQVWNSKSEDETIIQWRIVPVFLLFSSAFLFHRFGYPELFFSASGADSAFGRKPRFGLPEIPKWPSIRRRCRPKKKL